MVLKRGVTPIALNEMGQLLYRVKCKGTRKEAIVAYCSAITSRKSSAMIEGNQANYRDIACPTLKPRISQ
jgi:hypothetical protein